MEVEVDDTARESKGKQVRVPAQVDGMVRFTLVEGRWGRM